MRALLCLALVWIVAVTWPTRDCSAATARVSYVTSRTVYVDAGAQQGLRVGTIVEIVRDGAVIGTARVRDVSARRSACEFIGDVDDQAFAVLVGDEVRFETEPAPELPAENAAGWWSRSGLRGRIGVQTLHLRDLSGAGRDLDRPALDLRLSGSKIAGSSMSVEADVRARRVRSGTAEAERTRSQSRVYRLNAALGSERITFVAGRQVVPSVRSVHLFDGARLEFPGAQWNFGALAGTQPDPVDLGLDTTLREFGVWATRRSRSPQSHWELTAATVGSYAESSLNREYLLVQGYWANRTWSTRLEQEVDLNRSWKGDGGEPVLSATSTHLWVRRQVHRRASAELGLDTRRRVRLIRDRETPETDFDDSYRQGAWAGVHVRPMRGLDLGLNARTSRVEGTASADALTFTSSLHGDWLGSWRASTRSTVYRSELVEGWLQSASVGRPFGSRLEASLFGGVRHESGRSNDLMDGDDPWIGFDLDLRLQRNLWMSGSYERNFSGEEAFEQIWLGSGLRF